VTLDVTDLVVELDGRRLLDGVDLHVPDGGRVGLVGASGSGKSLTVLAVLGLLPEGAVARGSVRLDGRELLGLPERELARVRGRLVGTVFQDPRSALDPVQRVGRQIAEPLRLHRLAGRAEARRRAVEAAREVDLPDPGTLVDAYPHQLSGGQRQRVGIATALVTRPGLVLADEPTTALDVTTQASVLALFRRLVTDHGSSLVFVTHDLAVLAQVATDVVVLAHGRVVERATVPDLLRSPASAEARELVAAARATTWSAP